MNKKNALISGGGSGLGYAMAQRFIKENVNVIIVGRNKNKLVQAVDQLGKSAQYEVFDLSNLSGIPEFTSKLLKTYKSIDILINNAGIHLKKELLSVTDEEFQRVIQINQNSVFSLSREVSKSMIEQGNGCILNISSMASQYGIPKVIAYSAAKSAIEGMTRAMAVELSPQGIRVNCIAPGFIKTAMSSKALDNDPERKAKVLGRTPQGRLGTPEEVANAAWFLCSEQAAYITGVVLPVDGGNSISF